MANRYFSTNFYTLHKMPVNLDLDITIGASGAVSSFSGLGISNVIKLASVGTYQIVFTDTFTNLFGIELAASISPVTGAAVAGGAFVVGTPYVIQTLGNTTAAQWYAAGVPTNVVPQVGTGFVATTVGAGTGTVKAVAPGGVDMIEALGNPAIMITGNPAPLGTASAGSSVIIQMLNPAGAFANATAGAVIGMDFYLGNSSSPVNGIPG